MSSTTTATTDHTAEAVWASGGPGRSAFSDYRWECGCGHRYGNATPQDGDVNAQHAAHREAVASLGLARWAVDPTSGARLGA